MNRRDFLFMFTGCIFGGAIASTTGLGAYYYLRKRRYLMREIDVGLDDWVLSDTDWEQLQSTNFFTQETNFEMLSDTDLPGAGDYKSRRLGSLAECAMFCEDDVDCSAFTYAKLSHPNKKKRNMCWLKKQKTPDNVIKSLHYVSGLKN